MMIGSWGGITLLPNWIRDTGQNGDPVKVTSYAFTHDGAGIPGYAAVVWGGKITGRRPLYFLCSLGGLACVALYVPCHQGPRRTLMFAPCGFLSREGSPFSGCIFPELFPTRVRATGQGICYNVSAITAIGPRIVAYFGLATFGSCPTRRRQPRSPTRWASSPSGSGPETWRKPLTDDINTKARDPGVRLRSGSFCGS
jgi:hypothetical protein